MDEPTIRHFLIAGAGLLLSVALPIAVGWIARHGGLSVAMCWGLGSLTGAAALSGMVFVFNGNRDARRGP